MFSSLSQFEGGVFQLALYLRIDRTRVYVHVGARGTKIQANERYGRDCFAKSASGVSIRYAYFHR